MSKPTSFKEWREKLGLTQTEAAAEFGVTKSQVVNWDAGVNRGSGRPAVPPLSVRRLMTVLAEGDTPEAWPE